MGKCYDKIDDRVAAFIRAQHVFFVATAPSGSEGHINLSPKGLSGLCVLGDSELAYLDFVGSGVETIAHLRQNGRIAIMLCAFDGQPKIMRLHGHGSVLEPQEPRFAELRRRFTSDAPARAIIVVRVLRISDSCGYGVPLYEYRGERAQLPAWTERKGEAGLHTYQRQKNAQSIDGLPGLRWTEESE